MTTVTITELRRDAEALADAALRGERVIIIRNNKLLELRPKPDLDLPANASDAELEPRYSNDDANQADDEFARASLARVR
jgi:antitoxin (DNA-binding transcriptional repressor) of toxin-antitoxin stability system